MPIPQTIKSVVLLFFPQSLDPQAFPGIIVCNENNPIAQLSLEKRGLLRYNGMNLRPISSTQGRGGAARMCIFWREAVHLPSEAMDAYSPPVASPPEG